MRHDIDIAAARNCTEAQKVSALGGTVIRLDRAGVEASENERTNVEACHCHLRIENSDTIEQLEQTLTQLLFNADWNEGFTKTPS